MRGFVMILLLVSYAVAQEANTTELFSIQCCEMLKVLTIYMVPSTGDKVDDKVDESKLHECCTLKLVQLFVNHTRSMLDRTDSVTSVANQHVETVRISKLKTHIEIIRSVLSDNAQAVLVFAFLGRAVAIEQGLRDEYMSLEYNILTDTLSVRDSACSIDKTIYSTMVVASIALLVFFIATQVVETEKRHSLEATHTRESVLKPTFVDAVIGGNSSKNLLRMRMHL